jgi:hypothetical protein
VLFSNGLKIAVAGGNNDWIFYPYFSNIEKEIGRTAFSV